MISDDAVSIITLKGKVAVVPLTRRLTRPYIVALAVESDDISEQELRQLSSFQQYLIETIYRPEEALAILLRALPFQEGHNSITFVKGSPPVLRKALGWRYRTGDGADLCFIPNSGKTLHLVSLMDRIRRGDKGWKKWKKQHPDIFPEARALCTSCGKLWGLVGGARRMHGGHLYLAKHLTQSESGKIWCPGSGTMIKV